MSLSSLSSLFSLPQQLLGGAGGGSAGGGATTMQQAGGSGADGASALFGGLVSAFTKVAPSLLSAIPIVGAFAPLITAAIPLIGSVTGALMGGTQVGKDTSNQSGAIDSANGAAMLKMMEQQKAMVQAQVQSGRWSTPATTDDALATSVSGYGSRALTASTAATAATAAIASQRGPTIQVDGATQAQVATVDRTLAAIAQDPAGGALMTALAGRNVSVTVLDEATYQTLAARGVIGASADAIFISQSAVNDPRALTTVLVNGLAAATQV